MIEMILGSVIIVCLLGILFLERFGPPFKIYHLSGDKLTDYLDRIGIYRQPDEPDELLRERYLLWAENFEDDFESDEYD